MLLAGTPTIVRAETPTQVSGAVTEKAAITTASSSQDEGSSETAPAPKDGKVAATDGQYYDTIQEAVKAANVDSVVWVYGNTNEDVTIDRTSVTLKGVGSTSEQAFEGTIRFVAGSDYSVVDNIHFVYPIEEGTHSAISINGASSIKITNCVFDSPSALLKGGYWQRNGVTIENANSITVDSNTFNLGRLNNTNSDGDTDQNNNYNIAVRLAGGTKTAEDYISAAVDNTSITNNRLVISPAASEVTSDAPTGLLVANGNCQDDDDYQYGVSSLFVDNNNIDGSADVTNSKSFLAFISNASGLFSNNMVKNVKFGVTSNTWGGDSAPSSAGNYENTFIGVDESSQFNFNDDASNVARVKLRGGKGVFFSDFDEAVNVASTSDGAILTLLDDVDDAPVLTFRKNVSIRGLSNQPYPYVHFNGKLIFDGADGSSVRKLDIDSRDKDGSISLKSVDGFEVSYNAFHAVEGSADGANVIRINDNVNNVIINKNDFDSSADDVTAINIQAQGINDITVSNNEVNGWSGTLTFVNADGGVNPQATGSYGITNLKLTSNAVRAGWYIEDGSTQPDGSTCLALSNTSGVDLDNNSFSGLYGVTYSDSQDNMGSTGISLYDNYFDDCFAAVYFAPLFQSGKMSASDIIYREGNDFRNLRESSNKLNMSDFASGMAFAGWYSDSDFTMPPTDESNQVYAKFVPVSDVVRLMGGSLNMGAYATGDGEPDYSKTDLRFGFNVDVPNSSSKLDSWRWVTTYEKLDGTRKTLTTDGVNFRAPNDVDAWNGYGTGVVTNLLLTGIGSVAYGTDFTTTLTVTYTTDDGIQVTVSDSPQARSVKEVAELIKSSYDATDEERAYAEGILGAIGA